MGRPQGAKGGRRGEREGVRVHLLRHAFRPNGCRHTPSVLGDGRTIGLAVCAGFGTGCRRMVVQKIVAIATNVAGQLNMPFFDTAPAFLLDRDRPTNFRLPC